jgi:drug/metabolite transporter (DMT)-like permease
LDVIAKRLTDGSAGINCQIKARHVAIVRAGVGKASFHKDTQQKEEVRMTPHPDRTFAALGMILIYASVVGFADNYVRVVAAEAGLWQFHVLRSVIALPLIAVIAAVLRHRLRPANLRAVAARSAIHGLAMLVYFGALAFLPVAIVAAGLFTAPFFVLLIARVVYSEPISGVQVAAVLVGFGGVVLLLGPSAMTGASVAALLPVLAGALYAMGNLATRRWCPAETAETLLAGFFVALLVLGCIGLIVLAVFPQPVPVGAGGFILRGWVAPSGTVMFWIVVQAVISVVGVGLMIRAYQIAAAPTVSVFEYMILPVSAVWGLVIWQESLSALAIIGMGLIALAGTLIALAPVQSPTAARQ